MSDGKVVFDITGNLSGINSALDNATNTIARQTAKWTVLGQTAMNALTSTVKAGFSFVKDLALNAFEYNAQMETYEVNFKTMLGSAEAAQVKMAELKQYAAKTPFAFGDLADATQTMLAFGMTSEETSLALRHIGDISLGDANKLKSLTLAFSQVSSAGKLAGQDLLQMINAGFNPLKVIAEETGVAYADLKAVMSGEKTSEDFQLRMEAARREVEELGTSASEGAIMLAKIGKDGMISADMVAAAMRIATSEGGAFYKALENASTTAQGQISTIKDSWDMLAGKITGGAFDKLSQEFFPKVIQWLDDLNAAYDENGFTGLKTAANRIFGEIGGMALDMGADLLAKIYNGITGDTKTPEDIKGYLSEIFGAAGDAVDNIKGAGTGFLQWVKDNGELVGTSAKAIGIGFGVFAIMTNPLSAILTALAAALVLFTTDWETFEAKYPNIVAAFESLTGIEFSTFVAGVQSAKDNLSTFWNDVLAPLFAWLNENGAAAQGILFGIGAAMAVMGAPVAGIALMAGVIIANWGDIQAAVETAVTAVDTFFTQTIPEAWTKMVADVKQKWQDNVITPVDNALTAVGNFFTQTVPDSWNQFTDAVGKAWTDKVCPGIDNAALAVADFLGITLPEDFSLCSAIGSAWDTYVATPVSNARSAVSAFLTQTVPEGWNQFTAAIGKAWTEKVSPEIDSAALKVADFFGINVPEDWSLTDAIGEQWTALGKKIDDVIAKIRTFLGLDAEAKSGAGEPKGFSTTTELLNRAQTMYASPSEYGITEAQADEWISVLAQGMQHENYKATAQAVMAAYSRKLAKDQEKLTEDLQEAMEQLDAHFEEEPVDLPVGWEEGAEASLQGELDGMHFSTTVNATIVPRISPLNLLKFNMPTGWTGTDHASGGLFSAARRFLAADGMHTFGESGTEALLPLDTLWRKMGLTFDQAFQHNLGALQYSVMPTIPAAAPSAGIDEDKLAETIAAAVREAVSGLTVEMDKRTVGKILKPVISREIADDVNNRRWTS